MADSKHQTSGAVRTGRTLSAEDERVRAYILSELQRSPSVRAVAKRLQLSRDAVLGIASGANTTREGTYALARERMQAIDHQ
jgi:hypothetical protein